MREAVFSYVNQPEILRRDNLKLSGVKDILLAHYVTIYDDEEIKDYESL